MGPYSPDGQAMGGFLVDGQSPHFSMRHPAWPSGKELNNSFLSICLAFDLHGNTMPLFKQYGCHLKYR